MSTNKGGAAFPVPFAYNGSDKGMTLRDYFAAKAMQSLLLDKEKIARLAEENDVWQDVLAVESYFIADGMLAERVK